MIKKGLVLLLFFSSVAYSYYAEKDTLTPVPDKPSQTPLEGYKPSMESSGGYGYVQYLLWRVIEGETDYAIKGSPLEFPPGQVDMNAIGNLKTAQFDWSSGFRLGSGWRFTPYQWELEGNYTYYSASGSNSVRRPQLQGINSTFPASISGPLARAKSHVDLDYQMGNLFLAKRFVLDDYLIMRCLFGVTGGYIEEDWTIHYYGVLPSKWDRNNTTHSDWSYWGVGLRNGFEWDWFFGKGFSLFGGFNFSILYGQYKNHLRDEIFPQNDDPFNVQNTHLSEKRIIPHYELSFGPRYERMFKNWGFSLYAQYELNILQNLHYVMRHRGGPVNNGRTNLHTNSLTGFHGLTLGGQVNF
ncbi:MAG: hypothetical protein KFB93_00780 [Simkaniaceae bacterium]|nr:MAG: hypothetical protein KFB93_00780 [Simkaniaceae bacterium]